jgi:hypothetical protein
MEFHFLLIPHTQVNKMIEGEDLKEDRATAINEQIEVL